MYSLLLALTRMDDPAVALCIPGCGPAHSRLFYASRRAGATSAKMPMPATLVPSSSSTVSHCTAAPPIDPSVRWATSLYERPLTTHEAVTRLHAECAAAIALSRRSGRAQEPASCTACGSGTSPAPPPRMVLKRLKAAPRVSRRPAPRTSFDSLLLRCIKAASPVSLSAGPARDESNGGRRTRRVGVLLCHRIALCRAYLVAITCRARCAQRGRARCVGLHCARPGAGAGAGRGKKRHGVGRSVTTVRRSRARRQSARRLLVSYSSRTHT